MVHHFTKRCLGMMLAFVLAFSAVLTGMPLEAEAMGHKPLEGYTISVLGDSISTYDGWSNKYPITDPSCTNRYGEPYYGLPGSDCHNEILSVSDTWWHQAATELGAEILVSNAGNSTGVLSAKYPADAAWELYLQEMLSYKSRPNYLGVDGKAPDIIAFYIGSNELGKTDATIYGSVEDVDFSTLIKKNGSEYVYAEPTTVAEAYSIMLHKTQQNYPEAEIYCFTVVPNSGAARDQTNTRLVKAMAFNEMVKGVAAHFGAIVVDLYAAFQIDPDNDGVCTQAALDEFKSCFYNDPHPNEKGFDVITRAFVDAVLLYSRYTPRAETTPGEVEFVEADYKKTASNGVTTITRTARGFVTPNGMLVDFDGLTKIQANGNYEHEEKYVATNKEGTYTAEGGREKSYMRKAPPVLVNIPLTDWDNPRSIEDETTSTVTGRPPVVITQTGDPKKNPEDGDYDVTRLTVTGQGSASVHTEAMEFVNTVADNANEDLILLYSEIEPNDTNDLVVGAPVVTRPTGPNDAPPIPKGYDCVYIGSDQWSEFWAAFASTNKDSSFADETPVYTLPNGDGLYVWQGHSAFFRRGLTVPTLFLHTGTVTPTEAVPARYDSVQQFILSFEDGTMATAYCAERGNPTQEGYAYVMRNVDEANYYNEQEANMIRTVARNGYWGSESGFGSLDAVKNMMKNSGQFTTEEVNRMTDGIAMTATQYAVWTYSNRMEGIVFTNAYQGKVSGVGKAADQDDVALLMKLFHYLCSLQPTQLADNQRATNNTIINESNFLSEVTVNLKSKPETNLANLDMDDGNDVYVADLAFKLAVMPANLTGEKMVMTLRDENDNVIAVGRIIGELKPGEVQLYKDDNDMYTFKDIPVVEGQQFITFHLGGTQVLDKDVYFFTSEVRDGVSSQNLVGIAEGPRHVDVALKLSFHADATDEIQVKERLWRDDRHEVPPTGDSTNVALLIALLVASTVAFVVIRRRRHA